MTETFTIKDDLFNNGCLGFSTDNENHDDNVLNLISTGKYTSKDKNREYTLAELIENSGEIFTTELNKFFITKDGGTEITISRDNLMDIEVYYKKNPDIRFFYGFCFIGIACSTRKLETIRDIIKLKDQLIENDMLPKTCKLFFIEYDTTDTSPVLGIEILHNCCT
uniref:Uncharacterized protein n=1 Tax=Marseillevirus LCMAC201 TaxID=2506605 RepID=A0A481YXH8_9VIRU|nr:MAG: hypothetical protein LCMAC201_04700 [Marseillevirus LCMAC201]